MRALRVGLRLIALSIWSTLAGILILAGKLLFAFSRKTVVNWRNTLVQIWARGIARIIGTRITVRGVPPSCPYFLVANHVSYIDIIVLYTQVKGIFVAQGDLKYWPIIGYFTRIGGTIFINRARRSDIPRVNGRIQKSLGEGDGVIVFPEGTSTRGDTLLSFKPALFQVAAQERFPVHLASIRYTTPQDAPPAHLSICWWGDMGFFPHVLGLLQLPRFETQITFIEDQIRGDHRKDLARRSHELISSEFEPIS